MNSGMQGSMFSDNAEYDAFIEKFKLKKTTDDCYTPEPVYNAVAEWVANEYGLDRASFVRPFWPGGDYEAVDYPDGCCVVDNPPFSIRAGICKFYIARGIKFFLFAPSLTLFSSDHCDVCYYPCGCDIVYENGAIVPTSFVSNLDKSQIRCEPSLYRAVMRGIKEARHGQKTPEKPRYEYPDCVFTAASAYQISAAGETLRIRREDARFIRALDAQREQRKTILGGGFLLSDEAAAERRAAERRAAERRAAERRAAERRAVYTWKLSERERGIVAVLSGRETDNEQCSLFS